MFICAVNSYKVKSRNVSMAIPAKGLVTILALELLPYLVLNHLVPRKAST